MKLNIVQGKRKLTTLQRNSSVDSVLLKYDATSMGN